MKHRILIMTKVVDVDDPTYSYIHRWIDEVAKHASAVHVITWKKGYHTLPPHVFVHSLGEEEKRGRIVRAVRLMWYLARYIRRYRDVLVIDSPWTVVAFGPWWKLWRKHIGLWYAKGDPDTPLSIARPMLSHIFTSTTHGYHGGGDIKVVAGYGIDTERFKPLLRPKHDGTFRIVNVGAISTSKDYKTLITAVSMLHETIEKPIAVTIAGVAAPGEEEYAEEIRTFARGFGLGDVITFAGPMKNVEVARMHQYADCYVSVNTTRSIEKSLVEAASAGLPILTSNRSFEEFARDYSPFVFFDQGDAPMLAERLRHMLTMSHEARRALGQVFRDVAVRSYSIEVFAHQVEEAFEHDA
jgi:glycosyltransferase involved in cell wall biosynthesis